MRLLYDSEDPFRLHKVSLRLLLEVRKLVQFVAKHAEDIRVPILIMQGTNDKLLRPLKVRAFFNRVGSPDKTILEVEGAYHALFTETAMDEKGGWARLRDWLDAH